MSETMWHYTDGAATTGPVSHADLCGIFAAGRLPLDTPVWNEAMEDWAPAATVTDFRDIWGKGFAGAASAPAPDRPRPGPVARPGMAGEMDSHGRKADPRWEKVSQVRPWVRWLARGLDNSILFLAGGLLYTASGFWAQLGYQYLLLLVGTFLVYPLQLALFGRTIGKAYFGISVENEEGRRPTFDQAIAREWGVLLNGLGLGILFLPLLTMYAGFKRLKTDGVTSWDCEGSLVVRHRPATVRIAVYLVLSAVGLAGMTFRQAQTLRAASADRQQEPALDPIVITAVPPDGGRAGAATAAKKPRPKPKLLTLPSAPATSMPPIKPTAGTTRPAKKKERPAPRVVFKPEPPAGS